MARGLRVESLAEGVECVEQRDVLRRQGFRLMQGYLFGKPLPEAEFAAVLATHPRASLRAAGLPLATE
jgi:sensor c-di-GMP phosphodiesterase-like protein